MLWLAIWTDVMCGPSSNLQNPAKMVVINKDICVIGDKMQGAFAALHSANEHPGRDICVLYKPQEFAATYMNFGIGHTGLQQISLPVTDNLLRATDDPEDLRIKKLGLSLNVMDELTQGKFFHGSGVVDVTDYGDLRDLELKLKINGLSDKTYWIPPSEALIKIGPQLYQEGHTYFQSADCFVNFDEVCNEVQLRAESKGVRFIPIKDGVTLVPDKKRKGGFYIETNTAEIGQIETNTLILAAGHGNIELLANLEITTEIKTYEVGALLVPSSFVQNFKTNVFYKLKNGESHSPCCIAPINPGSYKHSNLILSTGRYLNLRRDYKNKTKLKDSEISQLIETFPGILDTDIISRPEVMEHRCYLTQGRKAHYPHIEKLSQYPNIIVAIPGLASNSSRSGAEAAHMIPKAKVNLNDFENLDRFHLIEKRKSWTRSKI